MTTYQNKTEGSTATKPNITKQQRMEKAYLTNSKEEFIMSKGHTVSQQEKASGSQSKQTTTILGISTHLNTARDQRKLHLASIFFFYIWIQSVQQFWMVRTQVNPRIAQRHSTQIKTINDKIYISRRAYVLWITALLLKFIYKIKYIGFIWWVKVCDKSQKKEHSNIDHSPNSVS